LCAFGDGCAGTAGVAEGCGFGGGCSRRSEPFGGVAGTAGVPPCDGFSFCFGPLGFGALSFPLCLPRGGSDLGFGVSGFGFGVDGGAGFSELGFGFSVLGCRVAETSSVGIVPSGLRNVEVGGGGGGGETVGGGLAGGGDGGLVGGVDGGRGWGGVTDRRVSGPPPPSGMWSSDTDGSTGPAGLPVVNGEMVSPPDAVAVSAAAAGAVGKEDFANVDGPPGTAAVSLETKAGTVAALPWSMRPGSDGSGRPCPVAHTQRNRDAAAPAPTMPAFAPQRIRPPTRGQDTTVFRSRQSSIDKGG